MTYEKGKAQSSIHLPEKIQNEKRNVVKIGLKYLGTTDVLLRLRCLVIILDIGGKKYLYALTNFSKADK